MIEKLETALWPLPPNYNSLTPSKQRERRLEVMFHNETPEDCVAAWVLLRSYYLETNPRSVVTWYGRKMYLSPIAHYQFVYDLHCYPRNVIIWPRFAGKSFTLLEVYLLWCLTRRNFSVLHVKADERFVKKDMFRLRRQLKQNPRILDDFGNLLEGGTWNRSDAELANGFALYGRSILGQILGFHTDFVGMDDVEFDDQHPEKQEERTERMKHAWTHHILPMLDEGCAALAMGTMNSRRTFTYYLASTETQDDRRLEFFQRTIHPIMYPDGSLFWPDKWDEARIAEIRDEMGAQAFNTMFMNRPGSDGDCTLQMHHQLSYYRVDRNDDDIETNPLASAATMTTYDRIYNQEASCPQIIKVERPFGESVSRMGRVLLVDNIKKVGSKTDYACVMVLGIEAPAAGKYQVERWYVLDMRLGRVDDSVLIDWIWELGVRWQASIAAIEAIGIHKRMAESAKIKLDALASSGGTFHIKSFQVIYSQQYKGSNAKPERIRRLAWRFEAGLIRYPWDLSHLHGTPFYALHEQTLNFTPDMKLLPYDDAIDTLAIASFCPRPKGRYQEKSDCDDPMSLIEQGKVYFPGTKVPLALAVQPQDLSPKAMEVLEQRAMGRGNGRELTRLFSARGRGQRGLRGMRRANRTRRIV